MDEALTPVAEEDSEHMELYTQNEAARSAVERELRVAASPATSHAHAGNGNGDRNGHAAMGTTRHHDHHAHEHDEPRPEAVPSGLIDRQPTGRRRRG